MTENINNEIKLFEGNKIRSSWDNEKEEYYFSIIDVIKVLTDSSNPRNYWYRVKKRMTDEEKSQLSTICRQLKLKSTDGKMYMTDVADMQGIFRIIQSIPSPKAEPFKMWLAEIGKERIRRAGEKIKQEIEEYNSNLKLGEEPKKVSDIGFKVFKVNDTNIKWYDLENFNEESQYSFDDPDSLDFVLGSNDIDIVYEIMLRQNDVPLSESLEVLTDIGNRTYLYASTYLICLETEITEEMIEKLASLEPLPIKFVFRDSAFKDNISLKDETFRKLRSLIERNSGESKISYRVEFI